MLSVRSLQVRYGAIEVLHSVSLHVSPGEIVTIVGANGAGKSTLLNALAGVVRPSDGAVAFGAEGLGGGSAMGPAAGSSVDLTAAEPHRLVEAGCVLVPEGRQIFPDLTVQDNLLLGGYRRLRRGGWTPRGRRTAAREIAEVCGMFPVLGRRRDQRAGTLSGGEQQMLALGRALMGRPRLLMLDQPSIGLAPLVVKEIFAAISGLRERGVTILLVEQNARAALAISDRGYVMETGRIMLEGTAAELAANHDVRRAYLGKEYRRIDD